MFMVRHIIYCQYINQTVYISFSIIYSICNKNLKRPRFLLSMYPDVWHVAHDVTRLSSGRVYTYEKLGWRTGFWFHTPGQQQTPMAGPDIW